MTRIGADAVTLARIPLAVDIAWYYTTGHLGVSTQAQMQAAHPGKVVLGIDATGADPSAAVRDWETGDKGGSLEQWVIDHNKASGRKDACVYCNRATIPEVRQLTGSQVLGVDYWLWVATLDGTMHTGLGVAACQVATIGGYDLDVVWDDDWHPSPSGVAHVQADILQGLAAADRAADAVKAAVAQAGANARRLTG